MSCLTGFENKVAVITGAGRMRSIGRSIAVALARAGCDVVLTGTGRKCVDYPAEEQQTGWRDIESVADEVRTYGRRALPIVTDIATEAEIEALAHAISTTFGRVDILVNNAGAPRGGDRMPVVDLDTDVWRKIVDVNLTGTFLMSKVIGNMMVAGGRGGSIVNVSSIAGKLLQPNTAAYAASKAAIHALTACMAQEVASAGIRVNAICPGLVDTSRMASIRDTPEWRERIARIPLGRPGSGSDVAGLVLYLCSDEASWVTGQAWNIDGGVAVQH